MCHILAVFDIHPDDKEVAQALLDINKTTLQTQPDGMAFVSDKVEIRSLKYEWDATDFERYFVCHTRLATTGKVTADNVHGYKIGDWQFFHNGWCNLSDNGIISDEEYWDLLDEEDVIYDEKLGMYTFVDGTRIDDVLFYGDNTDSYLFFEELMKAGLDDKSIRECVSKHGFYGIGVLINKKDNKYIVFNSGKPFHIGTNGYGLVVIGSYDFVDKDFIFGENNVVWDRVYCTHRAVIKETILRGELYENNIN